jgi:hypothetical protein
LALESDPDVKTGWLIIIGTVPIVVLGYCSRWQIRTVFRSLGLTGAVLIAFGAALGLADRLGAGTNRLSDLCYRDGLLCAPGARPHSRRVAFWRDDHHRPGPRLCQAAITEYAFLLALPAVFGSGLFELVTSTRERKAYGARKPPSQRRGLGVGLRSSLSDEVHFEAQLPAVCPLQGASRREFAGDALKARGLQLTIQAARRPGAQQKAVNFGSFAPWRLALSFSIL